MALLEGPRGSLQGEAPGAHPGAGLAPGTASQEAGSCRPGGVIHRALFLQPPVCSPVNLTVVLGMVLV